MSITEKLLKYKDMLEEQEKKNYLLESKIADLKKELKKEYGTDDVNKLKAKAEELKKEYDKQEEKMQKLITELEGFFA